MLTLYLNRILFYLCFAACFILIGLGQNTQNTNQKTRPYRFIFSANLFQNAKTADVEASTKILAKELIKIDDKAMGFEIVVTNNLEELRQSIKEEFDAIYISPVDMRQFQNKNLLVPTFVTEINKSYGDIYYLITNKHDNKKDLNALKNGTINVLAKSEGQIPSIWLDKILRQHKLPSKDKYFSKIIYESRSTNIVLPVFFKKVNAALVTSVSYDLLCELNPQLKNELVIIERSKPLVSGVFCFDLRNKDEKRKNRVLDYMLNLHKSTYGKQITELYTIDKVIPFKEEYLDNVWELYK